MKLEYIELIDFLNEDDQVRLKDYEYIDNSNRNKLHRSDNIKFMYLNNYKLVDGGILIGFDDFPVLRLLKYENGRQKFYNLNFDGIYLFQKRVSITKRDFFEDLLQKIDKIKVSNNIDGNKNIFNK
jgi:hypothetical protein